MEQEVKINAKEIIQKLNKIQSEINSIRDDLTAPQELTLEEEMKMWEEAGEEDILNWEKKNL